MRLPFYVGSGSLGPDSSRLQGRFSTAAGLIEAMRFVSRIKHPFCGLSHWIGAALALIGTVILLQMAWGKPLAMAAFGIYGLALVGLYTASGLYHSVACEGRRETFLRKLDHTGIFLLIAGTYVPVCLLALPKQYGWTFLAFQALFVLIGLFGTFLLRKFPAVLNVVLYLLMGWMAVFALGWIGANWPRHAIFLLVTGGLVYTVGAVIFATDCPHLWPGRFSAHDLWHVFVLAGSGCHYLLMTTYVARLPG
ncbi:hemolysin III family protein [bacterium]|nr:MAG: hemolysin III family protein [bacterium]